MSIRAAILGASGYGGGELFRLLAGHPKVDEVIGASRSNAGKPITAIHPNLRGIIKDDFVDKIDWHWLAKSETPVLFCAMPHGELAGQYQSLSKDWPPNLLVIDLSADFRMAGKDWVYGLPEWNKAQIVGAKRIANPGCFASALQLALLPFAKIAGVEYVAASGATGSSGSGMTPSETTHHPTRANDFRAYKMLSHQHMDEVAQMLRTLGRAELEVSFVPHSAPLVRGILVTAQALLPSGSDLNKMIASIFEGCPFVRLVDGSPRVAAVVGSNFADIGWATNGRQAAMMVAMDNLGKGMAGQAVQNMNLALGFGETEGLWHAGGFPY